MGQWINATITNSAAEPQDKVNSKKVPFSRKYLIIHNPSETAYLAVTFDGTTPVIQSNGITLFPGGTFTSDQYTMNGTLSMISSVASSSATLYWR
jgi:hypothetical protein